MSGLPTTIATADLALATYALSKTYGRSVALRAVDLRVPTGSIYLLVGPNGAGKSTTIKILLDLLRSSSGSANVLGLNPVDQPALVRANVGYVPEQLTWGYPWMKVGRQLQHHAAYFPSWDAEYASQLARAFELRLDQRMGTLSKGQGRRVHLAMALAHRPPVLILDEPTDGLDPVMRDDTLAVLIDHVAATPTTVLLCTHHVSEFEQIADHIGVLRNNALCAQLPLPEFQRGLRRYRADIPPGWNGRELLAGDVLRRTTSAHELNWTIWGDEADVVDQLTRSGATVRNASVLSLHDATLAVLSPKESPE